MISQLSRHRARASTSLLIALSALALGAAGCGPSDPSDPAGSGGEESTATGGTGGAEPEEPFEPAPGGIRRLLPEQIRRSIEVVLGDEAAAAAVGAPTIEPLEGFASIGAAETAVSTTDVGDIERLATSVASAAIDDKHRLIELAPCVGDEAPADACYADVAREVGLVAWRRPLEVPEVDRLVAIARAGNAWSIEKGIGVPFDQGLKYELMAMLQSPHFLYLVEVGTPDPEDPSRRILGRYELAARISFFLQARTPTRGLLDAVAAGALDTPDGIRQVARDLLADDRAKDALDAFYAELFYLDDLANVSKDTALYPTFDTELAASMREETRLFMRDLVWDRDADAREMFTASATFVDADLAALYGVEAPGGDDPAAFAKVELPEGQGRAGLLGHASFLARFAHPGLTSPTRRGHYVSARFLCEEIPPPPVGVTPSLPDDPEGTATMRDQLTRHATDPACAGCHTVMDPIGLAFEHFDTIGAYRERDGDLDLDVSGEVERLGAFAGPRELGQLIAEDERMPRCVVQSFIRSSLGHIEGDGERYAIRSLGEGFADTGYRIKELMVELTASKVFRYVGDPK